MLFFHPYEHTAPATPRRSYTRKHASGILQYLPVYISFQQLLPTQPDMRRFLAASILNLSSTAKRIFEAISNKREKMTYIGGTASHIRMGSRDVEGAVIPAWILLWASQRDLIYDLSISHAALHTSLSTAEGRRLKTSI